MPVERRNLYRVLFVQPEAPAEVVKASYRALMSTMRAHPDLGGDHEAAVRLNAAYEVLGDPERRRAYDQSQRKPPRNGTAAKEANGTKGPLAWLADKQCPLCQRGFTAKPVPGTRCMQCDSPLGPAPSGERALGELIGRRRAERFERDIGVMLRLPGQAAHAGQAGQAAQAGEIGARLRDLSLTGLSLVCAAPIPRGSTLRIVAPSFDTVASVVACSGSRGIHTVHARLLTLEIQRAGRGVFVSARA